MTTGTYVLVVFLILRKEMIYIAYVYLTAVTYKATGEQTTFSIPFDYLRRAFIHVDINGINITEGFEVDNRTVIFTQAPNLNTIIRIYRQTPTKRLVSWADASILKARDMEITGVQELHILEEQQDKANDVLSVAQDIFNQSTQAVKDAQAQAQAAAESAANAASNTQLAGQYADDAQSAMNTATKKAEQAADSATSAGVSANHAQGSMQNAQTYMQAAQKAMQQAGEFLEQAGSAAGSAQASAKEAKETAATIRSIAEEVAAVQKYLDAAQAAANEAATSESNAKGYANTATLAAQGANESLQQAQQQVEEAQGFAAIATTQAQEANKDAVSAAGSAMQAQAALDTLLANDDLISPDFATLNTAKCGDVVPPLYAVWDVAEIVVAARFGEMQTA